MIVWLKRVNNIEKSHTNMTWKYLIEKLRKLFHDVPHSLCDRKSIILFICVFIFSSFSSFCFAKHNLIIMNSYLF